MALPAAVAEGIELGIDVGATAHGAYKLPENLEKAKTFVTRTSNVIKQTYKNPQGWKRWPDRFNQARATYYRGPWYDDKVKQLDSYTEGWEKYGLHPAKRVKLDHPDHNDQPTSSSPSDEPPPKRPRIDYGPPEPLDPPMNPSSTDDYGNYRERHDYAPYYPHGATDLWPMHGPHADRSHPSVYKKTQGWKKYSRYMYNQLYMRNPRVRKGHSSYRVHKGRFKRRNPRPRVTWKKKRYGNRRGFSKGYKKSRTFKKRKRSLRKY